jgi:tetratricopeptide (TPR) repeat protein
MDGRYDDAERLADEAQAYGQAVPVERALQFSGVVAFELGRARGGGLEAMVPGLQAMAEQYPHSPVIRAGLVYLYSLLDRPDELREQFEFFAVNDFADIPTDANWPVAMSWLIVACTRLGARDPAMQLYEMFEPYSEYNVVIGAPAISVGSAEGYLALAAGTAGQWDVADEHFARGLEANERSGNRPWVVHLKYEYARLLAQRGDPQDQPRLQELLRGCLAGATDMGMIRVVEQTRSLADAARVEF